jgi:hypothetical protein
MRKEQISENKITTRSLEIRQRLVPMGRETRTPAFVSSSARERGPVTVNSVSMTIGAIK